MLLSEFRKQYPQYNEVPDKELADALYEKFYAGKVSQDEFYTHLGLNAKPGFVASLKSGASGLGSDMYTLAAKFGLLSPEEAEAKRKESSEYQQRTYKPTETWSEAPFTKFSELAGASLPYMAAPLAAGAMASPAGAAAAMGAAGIASLGQFTGSNLSAQIEKGGKTVETAELGAAAAAAIPQAALDVVGFKAIPLIRQLFKSVGKEVSEEAAKEVAKRGLANVAKDYAANTGKAMGAEGLTEAGQQFFERLQAGLNIADNDARKEYVDSFIGGVVLGGAIAPVGRYVERSGQLRKQDLEERQNADAVAKKQLETAEAEKTAAAQALAAKRTDPAYAQQVVQAFEAAKAKAAELAQQLNEAKKGDAAAKLRVPELLQQLKAFTADTLTPAAKEFNAIGGTAGAAKLQEKARIAALSPEEYMVEQIKNRPADAPAPDKKQAGAITQAQSELDAYANEAGIFTGQAPAAPPSPEEAYVRERVAYANQYSPIQEADTKEIIDALLADPLMAQKVFAARTPIPGLSAQDSRAVHDALKLWLNKKAAEEAETATADVKAQLKPRIERDPNARWLDAYSDAENVFETSKERDAIEGTLDFGYLDPLIEKVGEGVAQVKTSEQVKPVHNAQQILDTLARLKQARGAAETALQKARGFRNTEAQEKAAAELNAVNDALEQAEKEGGAAQALLQLSKAKEGALLDAEGLLADLAIGRTLDGSDAQRGLASSTRATLLSKAKQSQEAFITAALNEIANTRKLFGRALTEKEAKDIRTRLQSVFGEWFKRAAARKQTEKTYSADIADQYEPWLESAREAYVREKLSEALVKKLALQRQEALAANKPELKGAKTELTENERWRARNEAESAFDKAIAAQQPRLPVYEGSGTQRVQVDKGRAVRQDPRPLSARPLGSPRAASEIYKERLDAILQKALTTKPPVQKDSPAIRTQFAASEAAKVAEARGETAKTRGGELRRRADYVLQKIEKALAYSQTTAQLNAPANAVTALRKAKDAIESGNKSTDVTSATPTQKFTPGLLDAAEELSTRILEGRGVQRQESATELKARKKLSWLDAEIAQLETKRATVKDVAQEKLLAQLNRARTERSVLAAKLQQGFAAATPETHDADYTQKLIAQIDAATKTSTENKAQLELFDDPTSFEKSTPKQFERSPEVRAGRRIVAAARKRAEQVTAEIKKLLDLADKRKAAFEKARIAAVAEAEKESDEQRGEVIAAWEAAAKQAAYTVRNENKRVLGVKVAKFNKEISAAQNNLVALRKARAAAAKLAGKPYSVQYVADIDSYIESELATLKELQKSVEDAFAAYTDTVSSEAYAPLALADKTLAKEKAKLAATEEKVKKAAATPTEEKPPLGTGATVPAKTPVTIKPAKEPGLGLGGLRRKDGEVTPILTAKEAAAEKAQKKAEERERAAEEAAERGEERRALKTKLEAQLADVEAQLEAKKKEFQKADKKDKKRLYKEGAELNKLHGSLALQLTSLGETKRMHKAAPVTVDTSLGQSARKGFLTGIPEAKVAAQKARDEGKNTRKALMGKIAEARKAGDSVEVLRLTQQLSAMRSVAELERDVKEAQKGRTAWEKTEAPDVDIEGTGDFKYSRGEAETPTTVAKIKDSLNKLFGKADSVGVYASVDELVADLPQYEGRVEADARGFVDPDTGQAFLIAENIPAGEETAVALHELGAHLGMRDMLGDGAYKAHVNAVESWAKKTDDSVEAKIAKAAQARVEKAGTSADQRSDELLAYTIEEAVRAGITPTATKSPLGRWLASLQTLIKKAFSALGMAPKDLGLQELVDIAHGAAKLHLETASKPPTPPSQGGSPSKLQFSRNPSYSPSMKGAGQTADKMVSQSPSSAATLKANLFGLAARVKFVDGLAAAPEALKRGGVDDLKGIQANYYLRMYGMKNHFTAQAISNGIAKLKKLVRADGRKEWIYEADGGPTLKEVVDALSTKEVIAAAGSADAANKLFTLFMSAKRGDIVGYDKLTFGKAAAKAELAAIEQELASPRTEAKDVPRIKQRQKYLRERVDSMPDEAEIKQAVREIEATPALKTAFEKARKSYNAYNKSLLQFAVDTGALDAEYVARLLEHGDYIPYYRVRNGEAQMVVGSEAPIRVGNLKDSPYLEELVGGEEPIFNFLDSSVQNTSMLMDMSLRNQATKNLMWELRELGMAKIAKTKKSGAPKNSVSFKDDGQEYYAIVETDHVGVDPELIIKGLEGIPITPSTALNLLAVPTRALRRLIVASPIYAFRQLVRDSTAATLISGADLTPVMSALKQIGKERKLEKRGITGGQVFTGLPEDMARMLAELQRGRNSLASGLSWLEAKSMQADALTREAQYESYIKQGLSEMEATLMSLESMNFSRRGISPSVYWANQLIPFFNSQIQGLDVLYRSFKGDMPLNEKLAIRQKLLERGALMFGLSMLYAASMQDDEAYKNATADAKYNNWFLRVWGVDEPVKIPIPFELGYIFKAVPEAIVNTLMNEDGATEAGKAFATIAQQLIPGGSSLGVPAAVKPLFEAAVNKTTTFRNIESSKETDDEPFMRYRDNTTDFAKQLGAIFNRSPLMIEHIIAGYTGSMGLALMSLASIAVPSVGPEGAERKLSQTPFIGTLFQANDAGGVIDATYEALKEVREIGRTYNALIEKGRPQDAAKYLEEHAALYAFVQLEGQYTQQMGEITKAEAAIKASTMSPEEKRASLDQMKQAKIALASAVREAVRKSKPQ